MAEGMGWTSRSRRVPGAELDHRATDCLQCGQPLDSQPFDVSDIQEVPGRGETVVLARFQLTPQYCGVLEYFSQFLDSFARDPSQVTTPGLEWSIRSNDRPLHPYLRFERILNPWGFGSFPVRIRLDEGATVEIAVRNVKFDMPTGTPLRVGGRIVGRYWYDPAYDGGVHGHP